MKFTRSPLSKLSDRGRLRKEIGEIHRHILLIKRGPIDELTGRQASNLGRFHILEVSTHPRLEFVDDDIILTPWMPYHFAWHHYGRHDKRNRFTENRIIELRGSDWEAKLLERERFVGKMDFLYLLALKESMTSELSSLRGIK